MRYTFEIWDLGGKLVEEHAFASLAEARDYARERIKADVDKELEYDYSIVDADHKEYHIYRDGNEPV